MAGELRLLLAGEVGTIGGALNLGLGLWLGASEGRKNTGERCVLTYNQAQKRWGCGVFCECLT